MNRNLLSTIFLLFSIFFAHAQSDSSTSEESNPHLPVNLFLHLDKSVYVPGETIWFTGYVLNRDEKVMERQHILNVIVVDAVNQNLILSQRFFINQGIGKGWLVLPDTLNTGEFWIIAYSNAYIAQEDQPVFRQLIHLRSHQKQPPISEQNDEIFRTSHSVSGPSFAEKISYPLLDEISVLKEPLSITMITDSARYHARSKVNLQISIKDSLGQPLPGIFSISVVLSRRLDSSQVKDISYYASSGHYIPDAGISGAQKTATKIATGKITTSDFGYVFIDNKQPHKPVKLALIGGNNFIPFYTDESGFFELPYQALVMQPDEIKYVSVTEKQAERYKIVLTNQTDKIDRDLASVHYPLPRINENVLQDIDYTSNSLSYTTLKEAVVKANIRDPYDSYRNEYTSIHCDEDYVCRDHILNCPHHTSGSKPGEGERYSYLPRLHRVGYKSGRVEIIYHCSAQQPTPPYLKAVTPILLSKPFPFREPGNTTAEFIDLESTIYWNHLLRTDVNGATEVSFYSNDLSGTFTCTLQGLSTNGPISGKVSYRVLPNTP